MVGIILAMFAAMASSSLLSQHVVALSLLGLSLYHIVTVYESHGDGFGVAALDAEVVLLVIMGMLIAQQKSWIQR
eukprot:9472488-Pyramimonas_sp.AAC.1